MPEALLAQWGIAVYDSDVSIAITPSGGAMHYEKAPRFRRSKPDEARRLRCAALCRASLRYGGARE